MIGAHLRLGRVSTAGVDLESGLNMPMGAKPTLERAERAIDAQGRGTPFLIVYCGSDRAGGWQRLDKPLLTTLTTLDRSGS